MNLREYLEIPGNKYVIIGKSVWEQDPVSLQIAPDPRHFTLGSMEYTIVSLEPLGIPELILYMESHDGQYEFGWNIGNGKASYLTHSEILEILKELDDVN